MLYQNIINKSHRWFCKNYFFRDLRDHRKHTISKLIFFTITILSLYTTTTNWDIAQKNGFHYHNIGKELFLEEPIIISFCLPANLCLYFKNHTCISYINIFITQVLKHNAQCYFPNILVSSYVMFAIYFKFLITSLDVRNAM